MNYISELNQFYGWVVTHPLSPGAQALWNLLMSINNRAGWPDRFEVKTGLLASTLGMSTAGIARCRRELDEKGLLRFKPQRGSHPPEYCMISLGLQLFAAGAKSIRRQNCG